KIGPGRDRRRGLSGDSSSPQHPASDRSGILSSLLLPGLRPRRRGGSRNARLRRQRQLPAHLRETGGESAAAGNVRDPGGHVMIGCYDFCGHYEWTFDWLERQGGRELVRDYWRDAIARDSQRPAFDLIRAEGFLGMRKYWGHTL